MLPIVKVNPGADLRGLVQAMQLAARPRVDGTRVDVLTPREAIQRAAPHAEEVLSEGTTRVLQWGKTFVSVVLSVDAPPGGAACWHMSAALVPLVPGQEPGRIPDTMATPLAKAFGTPEEGPQEGPFKNVRHFRGPCWLD